MAVSALELRVGMMWAEMKEMRGVQSEEGERGEGGEERGNDAGEKWGKKRKTGFQGIVW